MSVTLGPASRRGLWAEQGRPCSQVPVGPCLGVCRHGQERHVGVHTPLLLALGWPRLAGQKGFPWLPGAKPTHVISIFFF